MSGPTRTIRDSVNRKITERFINDSPFRLILQRRSRVADGAGGWKMSDLQPIEEQLFTLIVNGADAPEVTTDDGKVVVPTHTLVGPMHADMKANDEFALEDRTYVLLQVGKSRGDWAKRAAVSERGHGQS